MACRGFNKMGTGTTRGNYQRNDQILVSGFHSFLLLFQSLAQVYAKVGFEYNGFSELAGSFRIHSHQSNWPTYFKKRAMRELLQFDIGMAFILLKRQYPQLTELNSLAIDNLVELHGTTGTYVYLNELIIKYQAAMLQRQQISRAAAQECGQFGQANRGQLYFDSTVINNNNNHNNNNSS